LEFFVLTDAHCHPLDLLELYPGSEEERLKLGVYCAASATTGASFTYNETLAAMPPIGGGIVCCFAVHPQLPAAAIADDSPAGNSAAFPPLETLLDFLETTAAQGRLGAVGETGFDLYDESFRATEKIQEDLFSVHLETALAHDLPLVLHVRRAMHKIFAHTAKLKKCRSVIFHSWPGTEGEGETLIKRGINVFFSFGNTIALNHREAMRCCARFPAERLLVETDAPYQGRRGKAFSCWEDLPFILETAAALRKEQGNNGADAKELEHITEDNFLRAFNVT
jgi:TatD DNase family protein